MACFAEAAGFRHVHVHVVPVPATLPPELRGARVMSLLAVDGAGSVAPDEVRAFCDALRDLMRSGPRFTE